MRGCTQSLPSVSLSASSTFRRHAPRKLPASTRRAPFTDYRELFGKVDAVSLAVPTVDHARIGVDLLEHGIDVLVEKPIASQRGTGASFD